jgi:NAD(P)-dependent dehydrogenase (short-subunit alcohol dehydrogenase family)
MAEPVVRESQGSRDVAVVTGAGRGLGRKIAERLARRGYHVVVTDVDEVAVQTTAAIVDGTPLVQDVRDPDSHRDVAREAGRRGRLGIWVNNAGVLGVGEAWRMPDAEVRRLVEVNLLGVIWGCHAAIDAMTGGALVNIASMSSLVPSPGLAVYSAAKHGVLGYSLSLAGELRRAGRAITVSALCPDAIAGEMTRAVAHDEAAGLLFSSSKLLSLDEVADAAVDLAARPRLVRAIPAHRAALAHTLRPFPSLGLALLERLAKLGRRRQR